MFKMVHFFAYFCNQLCHVFEGLHSKNKRPREVKGKAVYEGPITEIYENTLLMVTSLWNIIEYNKNTFTNLTDEGKQTNLIIFI